MGCCWSKRSDQTSTSDFDCAPTDPSVYWNGVPPEFHDDALTSSSSFEYLPFSPATHRASSNHSDIVRGILGVNHTESNFPTETLPRPKRHLLDMIRLREHIRSRELHTQLGGNTSTDMETGEMVRRNESEVPMIIVVPPMNCAVSISGTNNATETWV